MLKEFKKFISRGNVMDLAVGVVVGAAFTAIVNSLVNDIIMPVIGMIMGGINFTNLKIVVNPPIEGLQEAAITYGNFLQAVVNFLIVSFVIFIVVKGMNKMKDRLAKKEEEAPAAPAAPPADIVLLTEIRDLLKKEQENK